MPCKSCHNHRSSRIMDIRGLTWTDSLPTKVRHDASDGEKKSLPWIGKGFSLAEDGYYQLSGKVVAAQLPFSLEWRRYSHHMSEQETFQTATAAI